MFNFFQLAGQRADKMLEEYLSFGGYPRLVVEDQHKEKLLLMNEIYESYLKKDIVYLLKLDRPDVFTTLIRLCAHSCGSVINYNTLATDAGLSVPTLKKYLWYAEQTFVIKMVSPFYKNKRKEIKKVTDSIFHGPWFTQFCIASIRPGYLLHECGTLVSKSDLSDTL